MKRPNLTLLNLLAFFTGAISLWCLSLRLGSFLHLAPNLWRRDDFNHYYASAWLLIHSIIPYGVSFKSTARASHFIWQPLVPSATNPPTLLLMTLPLALFTGKVAWTIWVGFNLVCAISAFSLILWVYRKSWSWQERVVASLLFISSGGLFANLLHAQVQPFIILLIVLGWYLVRQGKNTAAAMLWGVTVALKVYTWPLLLLMLVRHQYRPFVMGLLTALALRERGFRYTSGGSHYGGTSSRHRSAKNVLEFRRASLSHR